MKNYFFVISETPINLLTIDLPPYIGVHDTHPLASERCTVFYGGGSKVQDFVAAVLAIYPDARATTSKEEAGEWLKQRHITPHKGGRTIKRSTDVTPEVNEMLTWLRQEHDISLGDLVEEAARNATVRNGMNAPPASPDWRPSSAAMCVAADAAAGQGAGRTR